MPRRRIPPLPGTPRLVGRVYPRPPGVMQPKIAEDGSGPLDLGLEPPRKLRKAAKAGGDDYTIKEAMRLTVPSVSQSVSLSLTPTNGA